MFASSSDRAYDIAAVFTPLTFELTMIVTTLNERDNIAPLMEGFESTMPSNIRLQVVFVDDSRDRTPEAIADQATRISRNVTLIHRPARLRIGVLGGQCLLASKRPPGAFNRSLSHAEQPLTAHIDPSTRRPDRIKEDGYVHTNGQLPGTGAPSAREGVLRLPLTREGGNPSRVIELLRSLPSGESGDASGSAVTEPSTQTWKPEPPTVQASNRGEPC